jgi:membrane-associated protease RseP (regulator of RpoE activity)
MRTLGDYGRCLLTVIAVISLVLVVSSATGGSDGSLAPAASRDPAPPSARPPLARVPIVFARNQVRVPVSVQGSAPFQLILDTGMPTRGILLHRTERVDALGLDFADADSLTGAGGAGQTVASRVATASRIEIGGFAISNVPVIVLPARSGLPLDTDGVIGSELFGKFAVRVDVDEQRLDLFDSATFEPPQGSTVVPLRVRHDMAFVDARVTVGSGEPVTADLAVDLGAGHALWLNAASDGRLAPPPDAIATTLGHGLSGEVRGHVGRVRRVELGNFAFEGVVTVFPVQEHQHPGGFDFRDGFVGAELLTRFDVTFDYAAKRLVLERGGRIAEPFEYDMTGMVLDPRAQDRRPVTAVLAGSPAEQAGVVAGDVLVAVDGQRVSALGPDDLARTFRRDDAEVRVTLERGATTIEKRLRLRRLV